MIQKFKQALQKRSREKKEVLEYLLGLMKKYSLLAYVEYTNGTNIFSFHKMHNFKKSLHVGVDAI